MYQNKITLFLDDMVFILKSYDKSHDNIPKIGVASFFHKWLVENCQGKYTEEWIIHDYIGKEYTFELEEDSILFKLTFI